MTMLAEIDARNTRHSSDAAFGVQRSANAARWVMADDDMSAIQSIMRMQKMPELVARILSSRGIDADDVDAFIDPKLARDFPDPFSMQDMRAFAEDARGSPRPHPRVLARAPAAEPARRGLFRGAPGALRRRGARRVIEWWRGARAG